MAGQNSGCGVRVVILALVFISVLNLWQTWRLNAEVSALRSRVYSMKMRRDEGPQSKASKSALNRAYGHLLEAQKAIAKGDAKRGSTELDKSVRLVEKAYDDASSPYSNAVQQFQKTLKNTRDAVDRMQKSLNEKPQHAAGGKKDE